MKENIQKDKKKRITKKKIKNKKMYVDMMLIC